MSSPILRSLWVGIIVLFCTQLYGQVQDKRISGKVVDENRSPISLATISLYDHTEKLVLSTATDRLGKFQMKCDQTGRYFVKVSHMGHQEQQSAVFDGERSIWGPLCLSQWPIPWQR